MNIKKEVEEIIAVLENNNEKIQARALEQAETEGATGGEIFDIVISILLEIKKNKQEIYGLISVQSERILEYAKSIGRL